MRTRWSGMLSAVVCVAAAGLCVTLSGEDKAAGAEGGKDKFEVWEKLTDAEGAWLVDFARKSVASKLGVLKEEPLPPKDMPHLADKRGVFVTINKDGKLRGCVGVYSSKDALWRQVWSTARDSAFMDPRFDQVKASELDKLEFEISVFLCPVTKIKGPEEFIVGKHGIFIRRGAGAATFLPHVAIEQGWDKETTLKELCKKARLPVEALKDPETEFSVYTTQIIGEKKKDGKAAEPERKKK